MSEVWLVEFDPEGDEITGEYIVVAPTKSEAFEMALRQSCIDFLASSDVARTYVAVNYHGAENWIADVLAHPETIPEPDIRLLTEAERAALPADMPKVMRKSRSE